MRHRIMTPHPSVSATSNTTTTATTTTTTTMPSASSAAISTSSSGSPSKDVPISPIMRSKSNANTTAPTTTASAAAATTDDADMAAGQQQLLWLQRQQQQQQHQQQHHHYYPSTDMPPLRLMHKSRDGGGGSSGGGGGIVPPPLSCSSVMSTSLYSDIDSAPSSMATLNTFQGLPDDLQPFDDLISDPVLMKDTTVIVPATVTSTIASTSTTTDQVLVLGFDISHMHRNMQFAVCASGVFGFSLLYGFLQELLSVNLVNRQLGLFLAMMQFLGYTILAYWLRNFVYIKQQHQQKILQQQLQQQQQQLHASDEEYGSYGAAVVMSQSKQQQNVPLKLYLGLSLLRAVDLAMTNLAMQYINYPAKTLMKSSRVVFTMIFGTLIARKTYHWQDYGIVAAMVAGLALFLHADATSSAVFHHTGAIMLVVSLVCDGAISNMSEAIMSRFGVGQDEFIFRMYSIALVAITLAAAIKGDLTAGINWMMQPGTYKEQLEGLEPTWSVTGKVACMVLFSSMGFFGSSCSAAITKNFGALTMSITSTARKATTLFLSFFFFNNVCTAEHLAGVFLFISALTTKSLRRGRKQQPTPSQQHRHRRRRHHRRHKRSNKGGGVGSNFINFITSRFLQHNKKNEDSELLLTDQNIERENSGRLRFASSSSSSPSDHHPHHPSMRSGTPSSVHNVRSVSSNQRINTRVGGGGSINDGGTATTAMAVGAISVPDSSQQQQQEQEEMMMAIRRAASNDSTGSVTTRRTNSSANHRNQENSNNNSFASPYNGTHHHLQSTHAV